MEFQAAELDRLEEAFNKNPINRLDPIRFRMDVLYMALAGLDREDISDPDDALATLRWFANGIAVDMTEAISDMEAAARDAR